MSETSSHEDVAFENVTCEIADGVAVVRVCRPKVLNALSGATLTEIGQAVEAALADGAVGAIVVTGGDTGKKPAFAAGADIAEMSEMSAVELRDHSRLGQKVFDTIEQGGKPVIAAVNGFALGGGLELAMSCHLRYASADAKLGQPEINLGIVPGFGGTQRLPRLVGTGPALELLLTGDMVDAATAHGLGLVDKVCAADELDTTVMTLAKKLAAQAPIARRLILDAVVRGRGMNVEDACRLEADLFGMVGATEDVREGLAAFLEKRKAEFRGR